MTNVQEALKAAQKVICEGIYSEDGMDGDDGQKALLAIDAALSEIEKCEPELYMAKNLHNKSYATSRSESEARLFLLQSGLKVDGIESEVIALCRCNTSPISKEWVGLTDKRIEEIAKRNGAWQLYSSLKIFDFVANINDEIKQLNTEG